MTTPSRRDIDVAMIEIAARRKAAKSALDRRRRDRALVSLRLALCLLVAAICTGLFVVVVNIR